MSSLIWRPMNDGWKAGQDSHIAFYIYKHEGSWFYKSIIRGVKGNTHRCLNLNDAYERCDLWLIDALKILVGNG